MAVALPPTRLSVLAAGLGCSRASRTVGRRFGEGHPRDPWFAYDGRQVVTARLEPRRLACAFRGLGAGLRHRDRDGVALASRPGFGVTRSDVDASREAAGPSAGSRGVELEGESARKAAQTTVMSSPLSASISSTTSAGALRIGDPHAPRTCAAVR